MGAPSEFPIVSVWVTVKTKELPGCAAESGVPPPPFGPVELLLQLENKHAATEHAMEILSSFMVW